MSKGKKQVTKKCIEKSMTVCGAVKTARGGVAIPIERALANATAVGATKNKIVVTRITSQNVPGRYMKHEERLYYDQTPENMRKVSQSGLSVRKIEAKK